MNILLLQLDGSMPNLALLRLAAHHRAAGDQVTLEQSRSVASVQRGLFDAWDRIYASLIFTKTQPVARQLQRNFPEAVIGGTGWNLRTLEDIGVTTKAKDYSLWPTFKNSIGFTQRGCRLKCEFCVVPTKEGAVRPDETIPQIYRGAPHPRNILLLDNDFFGEPSWRDRVAEVRDGDFKVCFNQGINSRMLSREAAEALATIKVCDDSFSRRRIYTAWDNMDDEKTLFRGLKLLTDHGRFRPDDIVVYILVGYWNETEANRLYRWRKLRDFGCRPYPMPFTRTRELMGFQRWIIRREDFKVSWEEFKAAGYRPEKIGELSQI
jgi:hypothetical protein